MIVVGVSPAIKSSGYAVLERRAGGLKYIEGDVIKTVRHPDLPMIEDARVRVRQILVDIDTLLKRHGEDERAEPALVLAVSAFDGTDRKGFEAWAPLRIIGALQAVADYAIGRRVPFVELPDLLIRKLVGGKDSASRAELRRRMTDQFELLDAHEHVLDAAAVAVAAATRVGPVTSPPKAASTPLGRRLTLAANRTWAR